MTNILLISKLAKDFFSVDGQNRLIVSALLSTQTLCYSSGDGAGRSEVAPGRGMIGSTTAKRRWERLTAEAAGIGL